MKWIRWTLAAQVVFFLAWAGYEEWRRVEAPTVILETLPVDPRDPFAGQYMQLRFAIGHCANLPGFPLETATLGCKVGVLLKPMGDMRIAEKTYPVWKAAACQVPPPSDSGNKETGYWVIGTYLGNKQVLYGIERYYFSEKREQELSQLRSGHVWVEAVVAKKGRLALKNLLY
jgi:uncharacterized membrane-anchored protein